MCAPSKGLKLSRAIPVGRSSSHAHTVISILVEQAASRVGDVAHIR